MKITRIDIFRCDTPFVFGFHSPQVLRVQADAIVVKLYFDSGISGYGESTPRPYVTGETSQSVTNLIYNHFSKHLLGRTINSIKNVKKTLEILEKECHSRNIHSYLSALGSIDIALLDALGKLKGVPVYHFLGKIIRDQISYTLPIPFLPAETIQTMSCNLKEAKFNSIKVLMTETVSENIERLSLIRSLFGAEVELHIEANGKWTYEQAIANLEKLKKFNIAAVEQPIGKNDFEGLKKIREITGIPVIVDESMCSLTDAKRLIDAGACDILNIKISKCGGLIKSKKIADFALSKGMYFQLGTHVGETDILNRSGQHFALISPNIIHFEGISRLLFENDWQKNSRKIKADKNDLLRNAGLGINLTNHSLKMLYSLNIE